jgi:muconolactone D-isomerase
MEFLVHIEVGPLKGDADAQNALIEQEAARARELAAHGILHRLWRVPGRRANWGIWVVDDADQLHAAISSLPLFPYLTVTVHPLARHPNDPLHMHPASHIDDGSVGSRDRKSRT